MKDIANIYHCFNGWRVQFGYQVIGTYSTLKGARIAASKRGYNYRSV